MTNKDSSHGLPRDISAKALLGFEDPGGIESIQLEDIQARSLRDLAKAHFSVAAISVLLIFAINFGEVPLWATGLWVAAIGFRAASSGHMPSVRRRLVDLARRGGT